VAAGADVLVVGGGIIGCAVARELTRRRADVRVFEARVVGAGATQASAGILAPYIESDGPGPLLDLTVRSLGLYDEFLKTVGDESGLEVEYRRCGTLEIAADDDDADRLKARVSTGSAHLQWLDAAATRAGEPALPESVRGALLAREHGYVAVPALTEALAWAAVRHGAEVETHRRIARIDRVADKVRVTADDGSIWSGTWVVIAAGSWTGQTMSGEAAAADVRPVRGQLLRLRWNSRVPRHVLWGDRCYVVPWQDRTVLVGATVEDVGFDERTTAAGVRDLLEAVCDLLPEAWGATFLEARAGLRPATSDGLPIIGPSSVLQGLVYATGHYRNGILLAPLTAQLIADYIVDGRMDPAFEILRPGRFSAGGH
jgi:glycine oxidase